MPRNGNNSTTGGNTKDTIIQVDTIRLKDGTELSLRLNGSEYESDEPLDESLFTDENLSELSVNGSTPSEMRLNSLYSFGTGSRVSFRPLTAEERSSKEITALEVALAEVYEMILGGM